MTYLSQLILNPRSRAVRRDLADCQALHRTIMSAFPDDLGEGARASSGVLHRLELGRAWLPRLLVQSGESPIWEGLPADYLAAEVGQPNPASRELDAFLDSLVEGEELRFRLRANPTRKVDTRSGPNGERRNGRRVKLTSEAEQVGWLRRKGEAGGFAVLSVRAASGVVADAQVRDEGQLRGRRPERETGLARDLTFGAVVFDGRLKVTEVAAFRQTVRLGIGSGKAYGFGLLSVAREP